MHLVYLHQHFTTPSGFSGTRSYESAKGLAEQGHQVTVICGSFESGNTGLNSKFINGKRSGYVDGFKVVELDIPYGNNRGFTDRVSGFIKFVFKSILTLRKFNNIDLVYATSTPLTVAIPALWVNIFSKVPYIFEVRDLWPELPIAMGFIKNRILIAVLRKLEYLAYKRAVVCVALSPGMKEGIEKVCPGKTVVLIPNACDLELFRLASKSYKERLASLISKDSDVSKSSLKVKFVFTGTLGTANDVISAVNALASLEQDILDNISFDIIGNGVQKHAIKHAIISSGLDDVVKLLSPIPKIELAERFADYDFAILTLQNIPEFQYGTSPNKFFDYISAGLPVIVNHPGWVANMLSDANCGFSRQSACVDQLAAVFVKASNLSLKERLKMSNQATTLANAFDRRVLVNKQISVCENAFLLHSMNTK